MLRSMVGRRAAGAMAAVVVGLAGAMVGTVAAYADSPPFRQDNTSLFNTDPVKSVTVRCPEPSWVFGAGGQVTGGNGAVVLTRVVPGDSMRTVTVDARARTQYPPPFSVTAYAVCLFANDKPYRTVGGGAAASGATARCDAPARLFGFGFALDGADHRQLTGIVPDYGLTSVEVRTGGTGAPAALVAYGICYQPQTDIRPVPPRRVDQPSGSTGWPKLATVGVSAGWAFGAGGHVTGPVTAHLDALVLSPDLRGAGIRASLAGSTATLAWSTVDDGDGAAVHALLSGTFE